MILHAQMLKYFCLRSSIQESNRLVGYYIGKCEAAGGCSAVSIEIPIDRKKRILNPPETEPVVPNATSPYSYSYSSTEGGIIDKFMQADLPTRQLYVQKYPKEIGPVFRNKVLRPEELVNLAKLLLSREIDEHSDRYSFPVVIYSLTAHSTAMRHEYKQ